MTELLKQELATLLSKLTLLLVILLFNSTLSLSVFRAWVDSGVRSCWEAILKALKAMNKAKVAKNIADKYGCSWNK